MRKEKNYREMVGSVFWGLVPFGVVCFLWVADGESLVRTQNIALGLLGALIGASAFVWGGYVIRDMNAKSQPQVIADSPIETLALALAQLAAAIASAPPYIIGSRTSVTVGPESSGTVIGKEVAVEVRPGASGTIIGEHTSVTVGGPNSTPPINNSMAAELRSGADAIRHGAGSRSMVAGLLSKARLPGSPLNVQQALAAAEQALIASGLQ